MINEMTMRFGSRIVKAVRINDKIAYKDEGFSKATGVPTYFNEDGMYTYNFLLDKFEKSPSLEGMGDDSAGSCHPH